MLSQRGVAVSPDKAFAKRLAAGLMAAGVHVETSPTLEGLPPGQLQADIVVVHAATDLGIIAETSARLAAGTPLVVVIPTSSLEALVASMKAGKVAAVLVADKLTSAQLSGVAARLLYGDVFGLEKIVPWGVKIHSTVVGDYQEKSVAISAVSEFAAAMGVRRKYRESIEQCADEMLMNALYDAPVDASGKQTFADIPTKTRISLRMEQKAIVQYACDGHLFALSVRDGFGTLQGDTVVRYLDKCLHAPEQIDRKAGGAGLGLYIICNAASEFLVNLHPGVATEATCLFDLTAAKVQIEHFGIFEEREGSTARVAAARAATAPPASVGPGRGVTALLVAAIALLLALIGVVAYPRLRSSPRGGVAITTNPTGATIEVDGAARGTTGAEPVVLANLDVGQKYKVIARKPGYDPAVELVSAETANQTTAVALTLRPLAATLVVESTPVGATLFLDGKEAGTTPVTLVDLTPGSDHQAEVRKRGYQDQVRGVHVPDPGTRADVQFVLSLAPEVSSVRIDSDPPGAEISQNGEVLAGLRTPVAEHLVQSGKTYSYTLRLPGYMPATQTVTVQAGEPTPPVEVKLKPGGMLSLETNLPEAKINVGGASNCQRIGNSVMCAVENGSYKVKLASATAYFADQITVDVKGADVTHKINLGYVVTASDDLSLRVPGAPANTHKIAFVEGDHLVTVVDKAGVEARRSVKVVAGKTLTLEMK